jgi:hypothetical protein
MNTLLQLNRFLLLFAALFSLAHAADNMPSAGLSGGTIMVPDGLKTADVQQAILLAGSGRGWAVKEKADGKVVLFLEQSGWRSTLMLTFDTKEIQIASDSGKIDKKTNAIKKQELPSWLRYLKQDITRNMGQKAFSK